MQPSASFFQRLKLAWGVLWGSSPSALPQGSDTPVVPFAPELAREPKAVAAPARKSVAVTKAVGAASLARHREFGAAAVLKKLQREGRLIDFLMQPIDGFSDAEVGVAARLLHEGCAKALKAIAPVSPLVDAEEGTQVATDRPTDHLRWSGVAKNPVPKQAILVHPGWRVDAFNLPEPVGKVDQAAVRIIAPAEVEP